jgi:hypothetical protein
MYYWYSVSDVMVLLINVRSENLTFNNRPGEARLVGEEFSALRENDQGVLVADPQHSENFNDYLSNDIDRIVGEVSNKCNMWQHMPTQIVIPLISGLLWRVIRIQICYIKKNVSLLWDDPFGIAFPEQLKDVLRVSIIKNINKLIDKENNVVGFDLRRTSITEKAKAIEQQQRGINSWDCGPIVVSNIRDYILNLVTENSYFSQYSIPKFTNFIEYEKMLMNTRKQHRLLYGQLSGTKIDIKRFDDVKKSVTSSLNLTNKNLIKYHTQISELSSHKIHMLFSALDHNRQMKNDASDEQYNEDEILCALQFINKPLLPRRLSSSFDDKKTELDLDNLNKILEQKENILQQLLFATDTEDFPNVINKSIEFVDKSLFIKEIIKSVDKVSIITRPRRWGKTTNMKMLKCFLSIAVDERGDLIALNPNKYLFDNLLIAKEPEFMFQGKYPVIFISFKNIKSSINENHYETI